MLEAKGFLFGSSTHGNDMLFHLAGFLSFLKDLKPKNRVGAAFGSFGWAGGAVKSIEKTMTEIGIELVKVGLEMQFVPDGKEMQACFEFGVDFAEKIIARTAIK
jgi:flavorubredoxin